MRLCQEAYPLVCTGLLSQDLSAFRWEYSFMVFSAEHPCICSHIPKPNKITYPWHGAFKEQSRKYSVSKCTYNTNTPGSAIEQFLTKVTTNLDWFGRNVVKQLQTYSNLVRQANRKHIPEKLM